MSLRFSSDENYPNSDCEGIIEHEFSHRANHAKQEKHFAADTHCRYNNDKYQKRRISHVSSKTAEYVESSSRYRETSFMSSRRNKKSRKQLECGDDRLDSGVENHKQSNSLISLRSISPNHSFLSKDLPKRRSYRILKHSTYANDTETIGLRRSCNLIPV